MASTETTSTRFAGRTVIAAMFAIVALGMLALLVPGSASGPIAAAAGTAADAGSPTDSVSVGSDVPATTAPEASVSLPSSGSSSVVPSVVPADDDDEIAPITWVALIAAGLLLAVAVWWMLRRPDGDGPHLDPNDADWPTGGDVI